MFKIGDFSKLNKVTVKMLRYYDKLELLKPNEVDTFTGYRYYLASQMPRLNRIIALKEIGFSLSEIKSIIDKEMSSEEMLAYLSCKKLQIAANLMEEELKMSRIEAYINRLNQEDQYMQEYDVLLKEQPAMKVASTRGFITNYGAQGPLWDELVAYLQQQNIKITHPCFVTYHDEGDLDNNVDAEVFESVTEFGKDTDRIKFRNLEPVKDVASVIHKGSYELMGAAYGVLSKWIEDNQYEIIGPVREFYLHASNDEKEVQQLITEIQFPVRKKALEK